MANTIRELIVKDIEICVKKVKTANGYENNIPDENVERGKTTPMDPRLVPAVFIYELDETTVELEYAEKNNVVNDLPVLLEIWQKADAAVLATKLNEIEGEIIKAVMENPRRAGYAMNTERTGSEDYYLEGEKSIAIRLTTFVIRYMCKEKDPFTQ